jgi:heat shock protein HslJ
MHHSLTSLVTLTLITLSAAGCANNVASPTSPSPNPGSSPSGSAAATPSAEQVAGTWTVVSIQPAGQTVQTVPAGASYQLALADGRVSTKVDCNVCGGSLAVGDQTITVGPALACTRAACPTMAFENAYVTILAGDSVARIDNDVLTLTSSRGAIRFRR